MKKFSKNTIVKRIKNGKIICPICGCKYVKYVHYNIYPEIEEYCFCRNCNVMLELAINSPYYSVFDEIKKLKFITYKAIFKIVSTFNDHF